MAHNSEPLLVQPVTVPQHFTPPTARERRSQAIHRLQVGLFGLATMLLMVALASIINDRVRMSDAEGGVAPVASAPPSEAAIDPLADIGVAPAADSTASPSAAGR